MAGLGVFTLVAIAGTLVVTAAMPLRPPGTASDSVPPSSAAGEYGLLPLSFEPNVGQAGPESDYLARGRGYRLSIEPAGARVVLGRPDAASADIRLSVVGGNTSAATRAGQPLGGKVNHFVGDPSRWRTGIPTYGRVTTSSVYPGIDLVWYGTQGGELEYDFIVAPGTDPAPIQVAFDGVDGVRLADDGALLLDTSAGQLVQHPPIAYQENGTGRSTVAVGYVLDGNQVRFALGEYDNTRPLVIDPVLSYSTYLGGTFSQVGNGIAVDASGNAIVVGLVTSTDFPTASPRQANHGGGDFDGFVTKLNATGTGLVYSTYLGGSGFDEATDVAVDGSGNAYITGTTGSSNFPTLNAFDTSFNGAEDVFVTKLTAAGALSYSTYLGGSLVAAGGNGDDIGTGIAVDGSGNAYVTGQTFSNNFPVLNAIQATRTGIDFSPFITKLNPAGSALVYSTYLPGSAGANGIAVDGSGNAAVTGWTFGGTPTVNAQQPTHSGLRDAFVTKLNASGSAYVFSTYLGGGGSDEGTDIATDGPGATYVTGWTNSSNFPTTNALDATLGGDYDAFVTKLTTAGARSYSTYLGGSVFTGFDFGGIDEAYGIAVDSAGQAHVTGLTQSSNFPVVNAIQATPGNFQDVFVSKLNATGNGLVYSTYLGGDGSNEQGLDIAVRGSDAYVTGETDSPGGFDETEFPTTPGAFQTDEPGSTGSVFVTKISDGTVQPPGDAPPADFDGDGDTDIAVFRPSNGVWYTASPATSSVFGAEGDIPVPGDYDGDGNVDQAVFRPSNGVWYINSNTPSAVPFGTNGDIPVPADYDGDGKTDIAVFRPSTGVWYIASPAQSIPFGTTGDIPVPGDYNGDGKDEIAVFRPSTGVWYINGPTPSSPVFGTNDDIPVPGDYDGDGDTDVAVFRPSTGVWYIQQPATSVVFGANGDVPQPGDYDGDGDTDIAVFRPSTGVWYVREPATSIVFGTTTDVPLALPYAIRRAFF